MPRKAAAGLPAAKAEIRKLKTKLKELTSDYEEESDLRAKATFDLRELRREVQRAKQAAPIAHLESVNFNRPPPPPNKPLVNGLDGLVDLLAVLERMTPERRYRLLAMVDAYFYDPPAKAAR